MREYMRGNISGDGLWGIQKSAEVIVAQLREGLNVRMAKET